MKKRDILGLCCGAFLCTAFGEDPIKTTMNRLLATAKIDAKVSYNQQTTAFISGLNYKLPLLQKVEFKIGADNFDLSGQQYGLAISPNTLGQMKRQKAMKALGISRNEAESGVFIHEALIERYQLLVDVHYATRLKHKEHGLGNLLIQKNTTLKSMIQQGLDVRIKDIADTENDRYNVQLSLLQIETNLANHYEKLKQLMGREGDVLMDFDNMVSVKDIEKNLGLIRSDQILQTPEIVLAKKEIDFKKSELALENTANKGVLSSVQVVSAPIKTDFFNDFGIRFTLSVPLIGNNRLKRNELAIDIKKAENKKNLLLIDNENSIKSQIVTIQNLIKKYVIYADKSENSLIKNFLNNTRLMAEMSANELLDLKLTQQKTEVELAKIEYTILCAYISLLDKTDLLTKTPFKNYLSREFDVF